MDEKNQDVKEEVAVETTETPSVDEETTEDVSTPQKEVESTEETADEVVPTETDDSSHKGASNRIRELNAKAKAAEAKAQSLAQRLEEITGSQEPSVIPNYNPPVEPGSEISPEQYRNDVGRQADAIVTLRLKQQETLNKIKSESVDAVRAYPELDPESDSFNKDLSDTVTEAVEAHVRADPYKSSVRGFVDRMMKPYQRAVNKEVGKASENLAKQVSESALRPTQMKSPNKGANEKSIAELEAELGVIQA